MSDNFLDIAQSAAAQAAHIIHKTTGTSEAITEKVSRFDLVTQADLNSEKQILSTLKKSFPRHNFLSEELGLQSSNSEYTWVIDPLDGTSLFTAGLPEYSVSIGLLHNNQPFLGVILRVATNEIYYAQKGGGAFKNNLPIHTNSITDLSRAVIGSDYQNTKEQGVKDHARNLKLMLPAKTFRTGAGSVSSLADLAEGRLSGFIHMCKPWDFAAGAAIVAEAGGEVTDWNGHPINWTRDWIEGVFSNHHLHH